MLELAVHIHIIIHIPMLELYIVHVPMLAVHIHMPMLELYMPMLYIYTRFQVACPKIATRIHACARFPIQNCRPKCAHA